METNEYGGVKWLALGGCVLALDLMGGETLTSANRTS